MKSTRTFFLILVLTQLGVLMASAQQRRSDAILLNAPAADQSPRNPYSGKEEAKRAGEKLFRQHCQECHGEAGAGAADAPSLQTPLVRSAAPRTLFTFLKNGNLRRGMPSWSSLPDPRLWQIVTYLNSIDK